MLFNINYLTLQHKVLPWFVHSFLSSFIASGICNMFHGNRYGSKQLENMYCNWFRSMYFESVGRI
jgi:hypothetical protein